MIKIKKIITATMIAAFALTATGCKMIEKTPEAIAKSAVAKVNGKKITRADLDKKMVPYDDMVKQQFGEDYKNNQEAMDAIKNLRTQMVDQLVALEIFSKKGEELKITPTGDEMNQEIDKRLVDMKTMFGNDDAKFEAAMKEQGLTIDEIKEFIKEDTIMNKMQEYIIKDVKVEEAEIKDYYEKNKEALYTDKPGADVAHILVADEETANSIKAKIDNGEDFAKLAKEYGTDATKDKGGSLGFVEYDTQSYDPDFVAGFKELKEGEVSKPVKTKFGYHIIKVTGIKSEPKVKEFGTVKENITDTLLQEKQKETFNTTLEGWKKEAKVKIYQDNI